MLDRVGLLDISNITLLRAVVVSLVRSFRVGIMILILLLVLVLVIIYLIVIKPYNYWIDKGVKQRKKRYLFKDCFAFIFGQESLMDFVVRIYNAFPNERYVGMYQMIIPTFVVRDPELLKRIAVKDFDHFGDRKSVIPDGIDPLWSKSLVSLKGDKWHAMRSTLSPTFTSSKMKMLFSLISECATSFTESLVEMDQETVTLDMKDAFTRYTNDVIATAAFGIKCNSMKDKENEFYVMGRKTKIFSGFSFFVKLTAITLIPKLCKIFGITFFDQDTRKFFTKIVLETIKMRQEKNVIRPDMLHLLMEAKTENLKNEQNELIDTGFATVSDSTSQTDSKMTKEEITDTDIIAQAMIFFLAGFESVSTAMCFVGHELALHPEIQTKLQIEIDNTVKECKGELTYEALMKMRYMDMVVSETLRLWPPTVLIDRICVKPYTVEPVNSDEKPIHLNVGDSVWFPVIGLHRDPEHFPNPDVFDPERFSDENKHTIQPYTYLPFGVGPRSCIGSRFALMEMKALFFHVFAKFDLVPVEKTQIPLKLKKSFFMDAVGGFWIGLKRRSNTY